MRRKSEVIRGRILAAAREAFLEKGYAETSIGEIARGAGVSPSTVYNYYTGKQAIFDALELDESLLEYSPGKDKKRREIVETALLMFGDKGYEGTSLEAIMKRMNMGKTTIYQFFDSKDELFGDVLSTSRANLQAAQLREKPTDSDWKQATRELGKAYIDMGYDPLREALFRTVLQQSSKQPEFGRVYYASGKGTTSADLAEYLRPYQEQGLIRDDLDLRLSAFLFLCSLFGFNIFFKYISGVEEDYTDEEALRHATELFFNGIAAKDNK